ncbi:MAG: hypothetical protein JRN06_01455 [Nitrososphaerota archaeon]|nr:hypothetical protein [Nitrososphaerota archaeon]MDG7023481.1 hypothetical protein [Nitrososphaerota archaeon]
MRGYCSECGRQVGGAFRPLLWQCPKCRMILCEDCTPEKRVGLILKKPACPECLLELAEGGPKAAAAEGRVKRATRFW